MSFRSGDVYLLAAEAATALGDDLQSTWDALCAGESAVRGITHFDTGNIAFHNAAWSPSLWDNSRSGGVHANHVLELIDTVVPPLAPDIRAVSGDGTGDADHAGPRSDSAGPFFIWAGAKGNAEHIECGFPGAKSGEIAGLPAEYRRMATRKAGFEPSAWNGMEINAACASSTVAAAVAAELISQGQRDIVIVCAADIVSRFTHMGFSSLKALTAGIPRPFDLRRDGLVLGDGAVCLLFGGNAQAEMLGRDPLARITGWGCANDANHITGPARDGCGLIQSVETALGIAGRTCREVTAFCAHGTSTVYNDSMELTAVEALFGPRRFPVYSVKGALGHTLGAAGGIEIALSALALSRQMVPPTVGSHEPEDRARGRIETSVQEIRGDMILSTNSGFGGVNAAVVLERP